MFSSMAGRSVVVTGGSRGIGRGIARVFAEAGAHVLITGRDETALGEAVDDLKSAGEVFRHRGGRLRPRAVRRDGPAPPSSGTAASTSCAPMPASFPTARLTEMTPDDLGRMLGTNVKGTVVRRSGVSARAREPSPAGAGTFVTSSITGPTTGYPGWSHYAASKAAPARLHPDRGHGARPEADHH